MPLKINDIIEALKDATPRERRKLGEALQKTGISLGKRDRPGLTRRTAQSVGVPTSREELGEAAEGKLQAGAQNAMDAARKALSSEGFQSLGTVADDIADSIGRMYDESQKFVEAGYTGQMYFDFTKAISAANKASLDLTGGFVAGDLALEAFRESSKAFALTTVGMQENLLRTGVALAATGFNMTDFAEIVEESAFAFNQNQEQIEQLTSTLIEVQREIPVASTELAKNFRFAQQNFAYSADQMMDTFIGLQKLSTSTGVGFDSLADSFGESMDSFEGSATKAGTLNQILGKSVFNSMELLTMTEEERANTIRDRIMESGRSIEDMGKFELRALAQGMGMSISDTRKFLRGDLAVDAGDFMKKVEAQDPTELKTKKLEDSVGRLTKTYLSNLRPMDQLTLQMRKLSRGFLIESAKYSDGIKEMMEKNFTMEQALSARITTAAGMAATGPDGGIQVDRRRPGGVVFNERTMAVTALANQLAKAMESKDKTAIGTAANAIQSLIADQIGSKNPLTSAVANGVAEGISNAIGSGVKIESKLAKDLLTTNIFVVRK